MLDSNVFAFSLLRREEELSELIRSVSDEMYSKRLSLFL
jgi:hypothetical protein